MRTLAAFSLVLCLALSAFARGDDVALTGDGCALDWQGRLAGRTIYGLDLTDNTRFTEYMFPDGRVIWTMDGMAEIQDDRWHIDQCELICWELRQFEDWCARMIETGYGFDVHDRFTHNKIFEVIIGAEADSTGLVAKLSRQQNVL